MPDEQRKFWEALASNLTDIANQTNTEGFRRRERSPATATYHFGAALMLAGLSAAIQHTLDDRNASVAKSISEEG